MSRSMAKHTVAVLKFAGSLSYLRCLFTFCDSMPNFKTKAEIWLVYKKKKL